MVIPLVLEHCTIKFNGQDGVKMCFRTRKTNKLKKVMAAYSCNRKSLDINSTTFLFAGLKLQPQQTPEELDVEQRINVTVKGPADLVFEIKKTSCLAKLMRCYCDRQRTDINSISFLYDGIVLQPEQTPYQLGMEDRDEIDAMLQQPSLLAGMQALQISRL